MTSVFRAILSTIILCIGLNNLYVVDAINVIPVWNAFRLKMTPGLAYSPVTTKTT